MATVNDPLHPDRIREGLENLRDLVTSIAGREAALHRAHAAEVRAAGQTRDEGEERVVAGHLASRERRMAEGEAARAEADGKWEARKQRILQAARRMRKQAEKPNGLLLRSRSALDPNHADRRGDIREVWDKARQDHREFVQLLASDLDEIGQVAREALKPLRSFRLLFGGMIRKGRWISAVQDRECARREDFHREARRQLSVARERLRALKRNPLAFLFRWFPLGAMLLVIAIGFAWRIHLSGNRPEALEEWGALLLPVLAAPLALHGIASATLWTPVRKIARALQSARVACDAAANASQVELTDLAESLRARLSAHASKEHRGVDPEPESVETWREDVESRSEWLLERASALHKRRVERIGRELEEDLTRLGEEALRNQEACRAEHEARLAAVENRLREELAVLRTEWDVRVKPLHRHLAGLEERFPVADGTGRRTTGGVGAVLPVGRIRVILENLVGGLPDGEGFGLEGNADFDIPLALGFPGRTLLVADGAADEVASVFERMAARVAAVSSPGSWKITIFDPDDASSRFGGLGRFLPPSAIRICRREDEIGSALAEVLEGTRMSPPEDLFGIAAARSDLRVRHLVIVMGSQRDGSGCVMELLKKIAGGSAGDGVFAFILRDSSVTPDPAWKAIESGCLRLVIEEGRILAAGFPAGADTVEIRPVPDTPAQESGRQSAIEGREAPPGTSGSMGSLTKVAGGAAPCRGFGVALEQVASDGRFLACLGESVSGGAIALEFSRENGSHLMVVGGTAPQTSRLMELAALSLAASSGKDARFWVIDAPRTARRLAGIVPDEVRAVTPADIDSAFGELAAELDRCVSGNDAFPKTFVLIPSLHRCRALKHEEDLLFNFGDGNQPNPATVLGRIAAGGGAMGIHLLVGIDTGIHAGRWLSRDALSGFGTRVLFRADAAGNLPGISFPEHLEPDQAWFCRVDRSAGEVFLPYEDPGADGWKQFRQRLQRRSTMNTRGG